MIENFWGVVVRKGNMAEHEHNRCLRRSPKRGAGAEPLVRGQGSEKLNDFRPHRSTYVDAAYC